MHIGRNAVFTISCASVSALFSFLPRVLADAAATVGVGEAVSVEVIPYLSLWDYLFAGLIVFGLPISAIILAVRWYRNRNKMTWDGLYDKYGGTAPSSFSGDSTEVSK